MTCCGNCNEEPALDDLLDDPTIALLMASDGISRSEIVRLMDEFAPRLMKESHVEPVSAGRRGAILGDALGSGF